MKPIRAQRRALFGYCALVLLNMAGCATPTPKSADIGTFWAGRLAPFDSGMASVRDGVRGKTGRWRHAPSGRQDQRVASTAPKRRSM
jgi:hypothetical protein